MKWNTQHRHGAKKGKERRKEEKAYNVHEWKICATRENLRQTQRERQKQERQCERKMSEERKIQTFHDENERRE